MKYNFLYLRHLIVSPSSPSDVNLAYIVHCAKSTCFVRSIYLHVSAVFLTKQKSLGWSKTSKRVHNFLAKRRALNDSKRLLSFLWPAWQSFERERDFRFGRVRRRKGKLAYFSLARAHACARIPFSLPFEGLPLGLSFFLDSL